MNHCHIEIDFNQIEDIKEVIFDETYASDPNKIEDLKKFAKALYNQDYKFFHDTYDKYLNMTIVAIKFNNLLALEVLWRLVEPNYSDYLCDAAEFGNLKTFQHCLYGFMNYAVFDPSDPISYQKLKDLASKNSDPNVLEYIIHLEPCMIEGELRPEYTDSRMEDYWNDYPELKLEEKWELYMKLSKNYKTIEERIKYQQALNTVYKIMITRDIKIKNKYYTGKLYIKDKRLLFEMLDRYNNYYK